MPPSVFTHTFPNGLTLLAERLAHVRSATALFLLPGGYAYEPADHLGLSALVCDMLERGAGDRDSLRLSTDLDNLGVDRSESVGPYRLNLSAGTLARNLPAALRIYADVLRRPHLPDDELEACQEIALQDLQGLEDSPAEQAMLDLRSHYYPVPLNRDRYGTAEGVESITPAIVRRFHARHFGPAGCVLSVAGMFEWDALRSLVEELFGDWAGGAPELPTPAAFAPESFHRTKPTNQTHIALAYPSVPFASPDYYAARGVVSVLSGGMSARLFTEVREKRGLCYSVSARHDVLKDRGSVVCYAGTRSEKAQQTLDVTVAELRRLREGVSGDELQRVKAGLKTSLIMQQESTGARAAAMASDWFYLGRLRPFEEVQRAVDALTVAQLLDHAERFPPKELTLATVGPESLTLPT